MDTITTRAAVAAKVRAAAAHQSPPVRQAQLATALGISQQTMSRRLTGVIAFNVDELQAIASFLSVPFTSLVATGTEEPAAASA